MELVEIMSRIEDVGISMEMERIVEQSALTKPEKKKAKKEKKKLRKRRKELEKEVERELTKGEVDEKISYKQQGWILLIFSSFLTALSFFEYYITFN